MCAQECTPPRAKSPNYRYTEIMALLWKTYFGQNIESAPITYNKEQRARISTLVSNFFPEIQSL